MKVDLFHHRYTAYTKYVQKRNFCTMTRAFGTALLVLLISNSYQAFLKPWNGIKWRKKKLTCYITLLFLKSLIFTGKNQWEVCIHASCSFPPLEPSRGPIPKIPVWTQSQSKFLGQFAVFLPSQCWCARFGELTAINNIVKTSRRARSKKKNSVGWKCPNYFWLRL